MCVSNAFLLLSVVVSKSQTCTVQILLSVVQSAVGMVSASVIIGK